MTKEERDEIVGKTLVGSKRNKPAFKSVGDNHSIDRQLQADIAYQLTRIANFLEHIAHPTANAKVPPKQEAPDVG